MAQISLTASMRSNLLSLQGTADLMGQTQERLATGKKVNSAIDNPSSYYTAQSLNNRANDLNSLLDSMGQAVSTIKAANEGITSITSFIEQAKAVASSAFDTSDFMARDKYAKQFDEIMDQINDMANDSGYKGINLLKGDQLTVKFSENNSSLQIDGVDAHYDTGLGITKAGDSWTAEIDPAKITTPDAAIATIDAVVGDTGKAKGSIIKVTGDSTYYIVTGDDATAASKLSDLIKDGKAHQLTKEGDNYYDAEASSKAITASIEEATNAISIMRIHASTFGNNYSIVQTREEFTTSLVNVLEEGADKLTLADMNEESANMLALQTRQQLAINSLSLASQAAQSVLKLFS